MNVSFNITIVPLIIKIGGVRGAQRGTGSQGSTRQPRLDKAEGYFLCCLSLPHQFIKKGQRVKAVTIVQTTPHITLMYHFWTDDLFTSVTAFGIQRAFLKSERRAHNNRHQLVHPRVMLLVSWLQENWIARNRMIRPSRGPMADFTRFVLRQIQKRRTQRTSVCDQWPVKRPGCLVTVELDSVSKPGCRAVVGTYMYQIEFHTHRRRCGEVECAWRGLKRIKCASPQHFLFIKHKGVANSRSEKKLNTSEQVNRKRSKVKSWKRGVNSNTTKTIWDFIRHLHQEWNARGRGQDTLLTS